MSRIEILHLSNIISHGWQQLIDTRDLSAAQMFLDQIVGESAEDLTASGVAWIFNLKGMTYMIGDEPRRAARCYIRCIRMRPNSATAWEGLSESLRCLGKLMWSDAFSSRNHVRSYLLENSSLIIKWNDSISVGDLESARSILSMIRWNIIDSKKTQETKEERLRMYDSIVWNILHSQFDEVEANKVFRMIDS